MATSTVEVGTRLVSRTVVLLMLLACLLWVVPVCIKSYGRRMRSRSQPLRKILTRSISQVGARPIIIAFFHPYCHAGGGGERVLWAAVRVIMQDYPNVFIVVYSGDSDFTQEDMILRAKDSFGIELDGNKLKIIHLTKRHLISAETWTHFTLIGQSLGSMVLGYEALSVLTPDIFIDTMGYAFTYPLVHYLLGVPIVSYTHYPTITTDMFSRISIFNIPKYLYWKCFAFLYARVGQYASLVMANSTWTMNHLRQIWQLDDTRMKIVYPPCDTKALSQIAVNRDRSKDIVCVAQFRPEKDHATIINAFAHLIHELMPALASKSRLILIGTVRNEGDRERLRSLRRLTETLKVSTMVDFHEDLPWTQVMAILEQSWIGTNAMWNEHFGIGIVEYMAAGLIPVVHDSAGPKLDIVVNYQAHATGFLATDVPSFARGYATALSLDSDECLAMRRRAQQSASRFSEEVFASAWAKIMLTTMKLEKQKRTS